ncbi:hypothetical protein AAES_137738 [Amazona aestiva]|uniref:Retroviral nucleocapsid Gag protein p24 C-terminal domain-containing protein n=1 Tax=Amazona aestiva TaxID=12930 RepID=A0A0Q3M0R7_AMAAE|nr:hypothetical protein AAES_137738 [Amazona aestiva]
MGDPPVDTPQLQARLAPEVLRQSAELALKAMLRVPDVGISVKAFTGIRQAKDELYMHFIDCLETAIDKQVENDAAKDDLLLKLATENANLDCQKVLHMLKNPTLIDMIEASNRIGSIDYVNENLAGHLAAALQTAQRLCFRSWSLVDTHMAGAACFEPSCGYRSRIQGWSAAHRCRQCNGCPGIASTYG